MKPLSQHSYNQRAPSMCTPIDVPDNIPTYQQARQMSRKLTSYFIKKGGWINGRDFFMQGFKKKSLDRI